MKILPPYDLVEQLTQGSFSDEYFLLQKTIVRYFQWSVVNLQEFMVRNRDYNTLCEKTRLLLLDTWVDWLFRAEEVEDWEFHKTTFKVYGIKDRDIRNHIMCTMVELMLIASEVDYTYYPTIFTWLEDFL